VLVATGGLVALVAGGFRWMWLWLAGGTWHVARGTAALVAVAGLGVVGWSACSFLLLVVRAARSLLRPAAAACYGL
jgi:hypothetical protein